jgi:hypothetical protein
MKTRQEAAEDFIKERSKTLNGDSVFTISRSDLQVHWEQAFLAGCEHADKEHRWISVKDRLPEAKLRNVDVWINRDGGYRFANYLLLIRDEDEIIEDFRVNDVTHWMPLPEPPKQTK